MAPVSFTYSIPYLSISFLLFTLCNFEWRKTTNAITIRYIFFILLIFIGLRGHLYTDYINYYPFFKSLPEITDLSWRYISTSEFENGFVIYSSFVKTICANYYFWVFVNTIIDLTILTFIFKKYSYSVAWSYIFFFAFMGLLIEMNLFRNAKSIFLFLLSIPYLQQKKILPYLALNILGLSFHSSSILYILSYFILNIEYSKKAIFIAFAVTNIIFIFNIHIISELIKYFSLLIPDSRGTAILLQYIDNSSQQYLLSIGYIERTVAYIITAIFYKRLIQKNKANRIFCNSMFLYYISFYICAEVSVLTARVPLLFIYSYWFVFPNILSLAKKQSATKVYIIAFVLCCMKIALSSNLIIHKYDNWLMGGIESFEYRKSLYENNPEIQ